MSINIDKINLEIEDVDFWGENELNKGGMKIYWSSDIGFGTLDIIKFIGANTELILNAYTECMDSKDDKMFTRKLLSLLVDKLEIIE